MRRKRVTAYLVLAAVSGLLLVACQRSYALWVVPGSTARNLVFGFSDSRDSEVKVRPNQISVFPCASIKRNSDGSSYPRQEESVWWGAASSDDLPPPTNRLIYGEGLRNWRPPQPLATPGCYVVLAYAEAENTTVAATLGFNIDGDGKVMEMSRSQYESVFNQ